MKQPFVLVGVLLVLVGGVWYWSVQQSADSVEPTPVVIPQPIVNAPVDTPATRVYRDISGTFSITLPTILSSTTNEFLYRPDASYVYTAMGPGASIPGVKFTIPSVMASGTNLNNDTYLSVEHRALGNGCDAVAFLGIPGVTSRVIQDGTVAYSFASSLEAAAGNRYEEYVYARASSSSCIAVRYFIHFAAMENFSPGAVTAFDKKALMDGFDTIRRTLELSR